MIHIDIINASTILTDTEIAAAIPALQKQITQHFYPAWGVNAHLYFVPKGHTPAKGHWWMAIMDNSDVSGALGYHDLTSEGLPIGKVFAGTDKANGLSWTVTLSHELVEMLADPDVNLSAQVDDTTFYSYETADPVEADELGYLIDGILVSDFVTPEWFENIAHPIGTKFDHLGHVTTPLQLMPGGYMSVLHIRASQGWTQIYAQVSTAQRYASRPKVGSRRERRTLSRLEWMRSTAHHDADV
jgi:hypothetical protein